MKGSGKILGLLVLTAILALGGGAEAATREQVMRMVAEEAVHNGRVPVALALGVARVESNFMPAAQSPVGARGVMQIMPATAMGEFGVGKEHLFDPRLNIRLGIAFLERLYDQYGQDWELALSHYNGGSLDKVGGGFVAHAYTRGYVADVLRWSRSYQQDGTVLALTEGMGAGTQLASLTDEGDRVVSDGDGRQRITERRPPMPIAEASAAPNVRVPLPGRFNYAPFGSAGRVL